MAADRRGHLAFVLVPDDISGREDMRDICAQSFIHYHFAAVIGLYSGPFNGDLIRIGPTPGRYEQLLSPKFAFSATDGGPHDRPSVLLPYSLYVCSGHNMNALRFKYLLDLSPYFRLVPAAKQLFAALQNRHLASETAEHLTEFQRNVSAADDDDGFGQITQLRAFIRSQQVTRDVRQVGQAFDFGDGWTRAGGDQYFFTHELLAVDLHRLGIGKSNVALLYADAAAKQALVFLLSVGTDDFILLLGQGSKINAHFCRRQTWVAWMSGLIDNPCSFYQILRRKTAAIHAGSANDPRFSHHGRLA